MKKRILAIIVAITMIAALFVPMTVSAASNSKTIVFEIGELFYNEEYDEIEVPLYIVENNSDIYAAEIVLESNDGLVCSAILDGDIKDTIDKGGRVGVVEFGLNYLNNPKLNKTVVDSAEATKGVSTTGLVATWCFTAPKGFTEADMADYTFSFGMSTMLVAFDSSQPNAVLKEQQAPVEPPVCDHAETSEVVTKEATCTEDGSKNIVCDACGDVIKTEVIPAKGHTFEPDVENDVDPTCTVDGGKAYKCACGETKTEVVPALGHGAEIEVVVTEPQVGVAGLKEIRCSVCDAVLRTEEIPALEEEEPVGPPVDPSAENIIFEIGELTYNAQYDEIEVPLYIVENNSDIYAAEIVLLSNDGLVCSAILDGDIKDTIDKGGRVGVVEFGFNYLNNPPINKTVVDSAEATKGVSTTGLVATWCFTAPKGFTEADMADYTFSFGMSTMLVAFDSSQPNAILRDKVEETCDHAETSEVVVDATCTVDGSKTVVCAACGETISTEVIPATGHTFERDAENDVAPTCTVDGVKAYKCACGETKTEVVPATGHGATEEVVTKDATCTDDGSKNIVCTVCGDVIRTEVIPANGHGAEKEVVVTDATCTAEGSKNIVCTVCGDVIRTEVIPAKGHTFERDYENDVAPTCTVDGQYAYKCACGETKFEEGEKATGHIKLKEEIVKEATCTETGSKNIVCGVCGDVVYTLEIEALGHGETREEVVKTATCTEDGSVNVVCTVCGDVLETVVIEAKGHNFERDNENDIAPTCTVDGQYAYKCYCGETKFEEGEKATGHSKFKEVIIKEATCTETGSKNIVCGVCGDVVYTLEIEALGHGETREEVTKTATCTTDGSKNVICTVCDEVIETVVISATGHGKIIMEIVKEATCSESGIAQVVCKVCDEVVMANIEILATDHNYSLNDGLTCGACKHSKAPAKAIVLDVTRKTVTLAEKSYLEYSLDGINWQSSGKFEDLKAGTEYTFYQRVAASENADASEISEGVTVVTKNNLMGDIDDNGSVNALDLAIIAKVIAGKLTEEESERAVYPDVDGNGSVNALDFAILKQIITGKYVVEQ